MNTPIDYRNMSLRDRWRQYRKVKKAAASWRAKQHAQQTNSAGNFHPDGRISAEPSRRNFPT